MWPAAWTTPAAPAPTSRSSRSRPPAATAWTPGTPGCTSSKPAPRDERNRGSVGRQPRSRSSRAPGGQRGHRVRGAARGEQDVGGLEAHRLPAELGHADVAVVVSPAPGPVELLAVVLDGQPRPRVGEVEA